MVLFIRPRSFPVYGRNTQGPGIWWQMTQPTKTCKLRTIHREAGSVASTKAFTLSFDRVTMIA
jgi:hypothetical protein